MNPEECIRTPRLCLRPLAPDDRDAVTDLLTATAVAQTYMLPEFSCKEEAFPLFERLCALSADPTRFVRGIGKDGRIIGLINDVEMTGDTVELGYALLPAHWYNGYAAEALAAAVQALFGMGFAAVRAGAFEENAASFRVMEKAGMRRIPHTDTVEYRGRPHRCLYCEVRKPE